MSFWFIKMVQQQPFGAAYWLNKKSQSKGTVELYGKHRPKQHWNWSGVFQVGKICCKFQDQGFNMFQGIMAVKKKDFFSSRGCFWFFAVLFFPRKFFLQLKVPKSTITEKLLIAKCWSFRFQHRILASRNNLGGGNSNIFMFIPTWGRFPIWLYNIFQMGWNHQLVSTYPEPRYDLTKHELPSWNFKSENSPDFHGIWTAAFRMKPPSVVDGSYLFWAPKRTQEIKVPQTPGKLWIFSVGNSVVFFRIWGHTHLPAHCWDSCRAYRNSRVHRHLRAYHKDRICEKHTFCQGLGEKQWRYL